MDDRATIKVVDVSGYKVYSLDNLAQNAGTSMLTIGSAFDDHIQVENTKVSPHHGCFYKQNGMWAYKDTNSTAGSSIKGTRIESTWLANGMRLVLDSRLNLDSLVIDVTVEPLSGRGLLPGEVPPEGWTGEPSPDPIYSNAGGGAFGGSTGSAYERGDRYGRSEPKFASSLNLFGLFAGILWAIIGVINGISGIKSFTEMSDYSSYLTGFYSLLMWVIILGVIASAAGCIVLSVGLFTYRKDVMSKGSIVMAAGYGSIVIALLIMLTEAIGASFIFIFSSFEMILFIISFILMPLSLVAQAKNFISNENLSKIYNRYYRPIVYYGVAILLVIIATVSINSKYGGGMSVTDMLRMMPSSNIWISLAWIGAIVLSGVYLHLDENPALAANYLMGANKNTQFPGQY